MKRIIPFILMLCSSIISFAQATSSISNAKKYLEEHILDLDPIEGLYDVENVGVASAPGIGSRTVKQNFTWFIIKSTSISEDDEYDFSVYSLDGDLKGLMGYIEALSSKSSYVLKSVDSKGNAKNNRFKLENGIAFEIIEKMNLGFASGVSQMTAVKSFPTVDMYRKAIEKEIESNSTSYGTGFFIAKDGYVVTNNHVIEDAKNGNIKITGINDDFNKTYKAQVEITDKQNDLAIIRITDPTFNQISVIPYGFKFNTSSVGEECFVLGYPLVSTMGKDIKLTNGIISSKTGYDGNIAQYQISAPVQPGNSGGPLFDNEGNIIGIIQAKHSKAENAGYAIKASYLRNLVELLPKSIDLSLTNQLAGKKLTQQVEMARKIVCLIVVNGE